MLHDQIEQQRQRLARLDAAKRIQAQWRAVKAQRSAKKIMLVLRANRAFKLLDQRVYERGIEQKRVICKKIAFRAWKCQMHTEGKAIAHYRIVISRKIFAQLIS